MSKTILALALMLSLATTPVMAANPSATLKVDNLRHYTTLSFGNLKNVAKINYVLVYDTATGQKGIEGGFKVGKATRSSLRRQILGSCSSGKCVYHSKIKNLSLDVTFTLRKGGTSHVTKSLP